MQHAPGIVIYLCTPHAVCNTARNLKLTITAAGIQVSTSYMLRQKLSGSSQLAESASRDEMLTLTMVVQSS